MKENMQLAIYGMVAFQPKFERDPVGFKCKEKIDLSYLRNGRTNM
jgi:hypothetical protein